jgi:hypothetical protein
MAAWTLHLPALPLVIRPVTPPRQASAVPIHEAPFNMTQKPSNDRASRDNGPGNTLQASTRARTVSVKILDIPGPPTHQNLGPPPHQDEEAPPETIRKNLSGQMLTCTSHASKTHCTQFGDDLGALAKNSDQTQSRQSNQCVTGDPKL